MRELLFLLLTLVTLGTLEAIFYLMRYVSQRRVDDIRGRLKTLGEGRGETGLLHRSVRIQ